MLSPSGGHGVLTGQHDRSRPDFFEEQTRLSPPGRAEPEVHERQVASSGFHDGAARRSSNDHGRVSEKAKAALTRRRLLLPVLVAGALLVLGALVLIVHVQGTSRARPTPPPEVRVEPGSASEKPPAPAVPDRPKDPGPSTGKPKKGAADKKGTRRVIRKRRDDTYPVF